MNSSLKYCLFIFTLILTSCEQRDWDNPFDPECPKEIFTPSGFKAEQQGNLVKLSWTQTNMNITGFKIDKKVENGPWAQIASEGKNSITWNDPQPIGGKLHEYRIYAYAGNNSSNQITTQITPLLTASGGETISDLDGNVYNTILIGTQVWMAENLITTKYRDGTSISNVTDNKAWAALSSGAYCWYNNNVSNKGIYGALYNWYAVNTGKLCPAGWHVPSDSEWTTLSTYLGGESVAGGKMKETGTIHWSSPNTGATNESGFSGLAGGYHNYDGSFYNIGYSGDWWSFSEYSTSSAWYRTLNYNGTYLGRSNYAKVYGFSVRCARDL